MSGTYLTPLWTGACASVDRGEITIELPGLHLSLTAALRHFAGNESAQAEIHRAGRLYRLARRGQVRIDGEARELFARDWNNRRR